MTKNNLLTRTRLQKTVIIVSAFFFLTALYAIIPLKSNHIHAFASSAAKLNKGDMARFVYARGAKPVPELAFKHGSGQEVGISSWRGKVVLLNLWATWCAPCRKEMPDLNALQIKLGGPDFEVVAVSVDRGGAKPSQKFLNEIKATSLALYVDESGKISRDLKAYGLPVTVLINRAGFEVGRLVGPAHWASEDALALIKQAIASGE